MPQLTHPARDYYPQLYWHSTYVLHAVRDGMHRDLTVLHKLPSPRRAELLRVSSPISSSNNAAHRPNGGREGEKEREGEREREGGRDFMPLETGYTGSSLCCRSYPVLVEKSDI